PACDPSHNEGDCNCGTCARATKHGACPREPGLNKVNDWRFEARRKCLPCRRGSSQREDSRANDCADADRGQCDRAERALHLPLGSGCFCDQTIWTLGSEKICRHCGEIVSSTPLAGQSKVSILIFIQQKCRSLNFAFDETALAS